MFLAWCLVVFGLLGILRLLRHEGAAPPSWTTVAVAAGGLAAFMPWVVLPLAAGPDLGFHALVAQVLAWRDGLPRSFGHLLTSPRFVTHAPGLAFVAADTALLSDLPIHRAAFLAACAVPGLAALGSMGLLRRLLGAPWAALGSLAAGLAAQSTCFGESLPLAGAFVVAALALAGPGLSNARAVATGAFLGAAVLADARSLVALVGLGAGAGVALAGGSPAARSRLTRVIGLAAASAGVAAGPCLMTLMPRPFLGPAFPRAAVATLTAEELRAMESLATRTRLLDVICVEPGGGIWIPAVAGRAVNAPHVPVYLVDPAGGDPSCVGVDLGETSGPDPVAQR